MGTHDSQKSLSSIPWLRQPSWWVVVVAGSLLVFFLVAIVREVVHGYTVRQQVSRLHQQVATEEERQKQLNDLLEYLASPTFQERQARLNLGLKKSGERVVIIPPSGDTNSDATIASGVSTVQGPAAWWQYFFGSKNSSSS